MTAATVIRNIHIVDNAEVSRPEQQPLPLTGKLYRFHGMPVVDVDGEPVGQVDWIWSDMTGRGSHIGVQLRWLRGTARAIPAGDLRIDDRTGTVGVAYRREQIKRAPHFAINRDLTVEHQHAISSHYREPVVAMPARADGLAA